ncbi:tumor protein p73 [Temnothorax longispinosus]|uniref:Tumor protein 63 n=1 Tax=Temnothorax longispinosus TaxID=300112 RepID=A0A4S2JFH1_9HYME|nr:Tumor protein 63 [Temnothorax longispinosus]
MLGVNGVTTGVSVYSDSQESALIDEETFKDIETSFGGTLPVVPENIHELEVMEEKPDTFAMSANISVAVEKKLKRKMEIEDDDREHYYPEYPALYNDYLGCPLNFQFTFGDSNGQDWVYSEVLKKLYIKMEKVLPLRFTWEPAMPGLLLRTELVFLLDEHKSDPVKRCYNHAAITNHVNQTMEQGRIKHVVHCVNHASSIYKEKDGYLSILTPLCTPEAGSQYVPMCFKFFCKNSCPSGMNRRATELVFTLENEQNRTLARRTIVIRICSCPKRDKQKDEAEYGEDPLSSVKRKILTPNKKMSYDKHVYKVELNIVGKENYLAVYNYAYDIMAGQAAKTGQHDVFKPYMDAILNQIP